MSNNKETYLGRFKGRNSLIKIGRKTSEKAHIMLNYLIENEYSGIKLSRDQYLITWFSEDVKNSKNIDITFKKFNFNDFLNQLAEAENKTTPANINTKNISQSFKLGRVNYNDDSNFYCMVIDLSSSGRAAIKYFNQLKVSELQNNLDIWEKRYHWYKYNESIGDFNPFTP